MAKSTRVRLKPFRAPADGPAAPRSAVAPPVRIGEDTLMPLGMVAGHHFALRRAATETS
jgi:hypothetical protein